ncbi:response regulator transcription factor [Alicyclobacillus cycloheptanicus]|uniref:DNA-binding CsgD family transcriptional regulator n=1 Tax=Alicyclobacillus cycloheptanicus TaxID=1457 RepID=A0ABT9XFK2_9BACL|nr:response regulator transcription factor [Alicyclobacillus cycloheptanicus]MDQ0188613.1 DNA-binding CsgD family transcriptional regulator [Alicyclobacillus cycloheptanicus]WDM00704.1 response regulator transcription factor [Alicyclobacillus cycloheptanicus]
MAAQSSIRPSLTPEVAHRIQELVTTAALSLQDEQDVLGLLEWLHALVFDAVQARPDEEALDQHDPMFAERLNHMLGRILRHVCETFDFRRSALFLYSSLDGTLEGVHGYNVQLRDIQRIRENEFNLPALRRSFDILRPVYFREAETVFPRQYVKRFHLTSILIVPLGEAGKLPAAFLLLDRGGERFTPDPDAVASVHQVLVRIARPLISHLYTAAVNPSLRRTPPAPLTRREQEVLQLVANGLETKDVAERLKLSDYTVTEHVGSAMRKLHARNRTEAVAIALRWRMIE